jgi:WD40 repeat protein
VDKTVKLWELVGREGMPGTGHARGDRRGHQPGWQAAGVRLGRPFGAAVGRRHRQELFTLTGHADRVTALAFTPDGATLISANDDHTLKLWNTATGKDTDDPRSGAAAQVPVMAVTPDGKRVVLWVANTIMKPTT